MTNPGYNGLFEALKELLDELARCQVVEFELVRDDTRIYLRKDECSAHRAMGVAAVLPSTALAASPSHNGHLPICTPLTGVFYLTASPGSPPYVKVGDQVEVGQVVGLVEAMKVFNEIRSDSRGQVAAILVQSGELVQKGQPLLHLRGE